MTTPKVTELTTRQLFERLVVATDEIARLQVELFDARQAVLTEGQALLAAIKERDTAEAKAARLRAALKTHGIHDRACALYGASACDCGLDAALGGAS